MVIVSIDIYRAIDWATPNPPRLPMRTPAGEASHRARGKFGGVTETPPEAREIDYRFTLANERTFLSWIRTALGLLAGGVAVQTLVQPFHHAGVRHALAASCLALAVVVSIGAYVHWRDVKNRMDRAQPLKGTMLVPCSRSASGWWRFWPPSRSSTDETARHLRGGTHGSGLAPHRIDRRRNRSGADGPRTHP